MVATRAKKFESHTKITTFYLTCLSLCPPVCFPGLQVCLTRCFLLQNAEAPCNQHFQSERGLYAMFYHTHHIKPIYRVRKALPEFFLCIFSFLTCLKKPVFSERDLLQWKVPASQAVVGSSDQRKVPASLSLFLKCEKIPALLYIGEGLEKGPFCDLRCVPQEQVENHTSPVAVQGPRLIFCWYVASICPCWVLGGY